MVNIEAVYSAYVRKVSEGNYLIGQLSFVTIKGKVRTIVRDIIIFIERRRNGRFWFRTSEEK